MAEKTKQNLVSSLCKHLSLDHKSFSADIDKCDTRSLCINILKTSPNGSSLLSNEEVMKWITFVDNFPVDSGACFQLVKGLNDELAQKAVILGNGLQLCEADIVVYAVLHPFVVGIAKSEKEKLPHLLRWMEYVHSKEALGDAFEMIHLEKAPFDPPVSKVAAKVEAKSDVKDAPKDSQADSKRMGTSKEQKSAEAPTADKSSKKDSDKKTVGGKQQASNEKKKLPDKEAADKDNEVPVFLLNIQVGVIRKAWKHPSADSLLVEEIDIGEANVRQVVSGLAKYCSPDELTNRRVALITNVKPGKLRDVLSQGLVLCASNEDHSKVEPLFVPVGANPGERISISGHEGKPEDVLNPKKKQLEKITPHLYTDDKGVATYKGIPFMTSAGACTSSISRASIK